MDWEDTPDLLDIVVTRLAECALDYGAKTASKWQPDRAIQDFDMPFAYHWFGATFPALLPSTGRLIQPRYFTQRLVIGHMEDGTETLSEGNELFVRAAPWLTKVHLYYHIFNQLQTSDTPMQALRYVVGIGEDNAAPLVRDTGLKAVKDPSGVAVTGPYLSKLPLAAILSNK